MIKNQKGQSLIEMGIFVAFIVAPLMMLVPYFSKLIEARHYNDMAARYVAWERTVWFENKPGNWSGSSNSIALKNTQSVLDEVPHRIINGHRSIVFSDANSERKKWDQEQAAEYYRFNQASQDSSEFLLADFNESNENEGEKRYFDQSVVNKQIPGKVTALVGSALSVLQITGLSLETRGMYEGRSSIEINSHKLLENINGDATKKDGSKRLGQFEFYLESKNYIVADGWNSGGPNHNRRRVEALVPANLLDVSLLNTIRNLISNIPIAKPLRSSSLKLGHTDVELLPAHRTESNVDANND